jgi:hypothetical protein
MESANDDVDPVSPELPTEVERPRELVRLNANEPYYELGVGPPAPPDDSLHGDFFSRLIEGRDLDLKITEHPVPFQILGQAVQHIESVAREHPLPKADDVPMVVVLGRFDQDDPESSDPPLLGQPIVRRRACKLA